MKNKGFTLLELLVVVSIIGILIAIGSAAFTTAQKKGRDARRRADMRAYQTTFEQYFAENSEYDTCATMDNYFSGGSAPLDPKTGSGYDCQTGGSPVDAYCVCATLDFTGTGNGDDANNDGTCDWNATNGDVFCVQNLQ